MTCPLLLRGESVISALVFFREQRIREGSSFSSGQFLCI